MGEDDGYSTPEEAALSRWEPAANARVREVRMQRYRATVLVDTDLSDSLTVRCARRTDGRWEWTHEPSA